MDDPAPRQTPDSGRDPGGAVATLALAVGALWVLGASAAAVALFGFERILSSSMVETGALAAAIVLPAMMALFSGAAVRESVRARAEARRLADAADRLMNPDQSAEDGARKLAMTVRGEISTLDRALEQTLARLQEVEGVIQRHARTVDDMHDQAKAGANVMISGMEREREELLRISRELTGQAQTIGGAISRHTQQISEAARQAETELRAADQALDHRLTSFGAAAALITDRTQSLSGAAQASADSALRLETALSNALDVLSKATHLTDAARQSAEAATLAANSTAGALRDSTSRAVDDAKRAADLIRNESVGIEREAAIALERLRDAAEAARSAAIGARSAVEDASPQQQPTNRRRRSEPDQRYDNSWRNAEPDPLEGPPRQQNEASFGERGQPQPQQQGDWTWRDLLSSVEQDGQPPRPPGSRRPVAPDAVARLQSQITDPRGEPSLPVTAIIGQAGLTLSEVFSPSALERIAQRSRSGTQSRRRAVRDAAPNATRTLAEFLSRDARANQEAMQFLRNDGARIAELIGRGRAAMTAEATRVFLLIDAAAG